LTGARTGVSPARAAGQKRAEAAAVSLLLERAPVALDDELQPPEIALDRPPDHGPEERPGKPLHPAGLRVAAPPRAVFRYLTESALWARWQGESADLDPTPGGRFVVRMAEGQVVEGEFVVVETDRRVVVTWGWQGHPRMPPGTSAVEFELLADGEGTIIRLTHRGLPPEDVPIHRAGWDVFLPRLEAAAKGVNPGPNPVGRDESR
jgi:uncharacterized protein YndB with AHSA1/START domain